MIVFVNETSMGENNFDLKIKVADEISKTIWYYLSNIILKNTKIIIAYMHLGEECWHGCFLVRAEEVDFFVFLMNSRSRLIVNLVHFDKGKKKEEKFG